MTIAMLSIIINTFAGDASLKHHIEEVLELRNKLRVLLDNVINESEFGADEYIPEGTNAFH